jgi:hypothetical protein
VGLVYEVKFDMAGNPETVLCAGGLKTIQASAGDMTATFTFDPTGQTSDDMGWEEKSFEFTATDTTTTLTFVSLTSGCSGPTLDKVEVVGK